MARVDLVRLAQLLLAGRVVAHVRRPLCEKLGVHIARPARIAVVTVAFGFGDAASVQVVPFHMCDVPAVLPRHILCDPRAESRAKPLCFWCAIGLSEVGNGYGDTGNSGIMLPE